MGTLHCALENGVDLYVKSIRRYDDTIALGLLKKEKEEKLEERRRMPNRDFFILALRT